MAPIEEAIVVRNAKYGDKYCAYVIIEKRYGMYSIVNLYISGESQNIKNKLKSEALKGNANKLKKDLDTRAKNGDSVGFTLTGLGMAKLTSTILKPNQQNLNDENDYYMIINGVIIQAIQEFNNSTGNYNPEFNSKPVNDIQAKSEKNERVNNNYTNNIKNEKTNSSTNTNQLRKSDTTTSKSSKKIEIKDKINIGNKGEDNKKLITLSLILTVITCIIGSVRFYNDKLSDWIIMIVMLLVSYYFSLNYIMNKKPKALGILGIIIIVVSILVAIGG